MRLLINLSVKGLIGAGFVGFEEGSPMGALAWPALVSWNDFTRLLAKDSVNEDNIDWTSLPPDSIGIW